MNANVRNYIGKMHAIRKKQPREILIKFNYW